MATQNFFTNKNGSTLLHCNTTCRTTVGHTLTISKPLGVLHHSQGHLRKEKSHKEQFSASEQIIVSAIVLLKHTINQLQNFGPF